MTNLRRVAFPVVFLLALAACGSATAPTDLAGSYTLSTINGAPLPAVIASDASLTTYGVSGGIVLRADGTFTETRGTITVATGHAPIGQTLIGISSGSYVASGSAITFDFGGPAFAGQFGSDFVTYTNGPATFRFQRQ